MKYRFGELVASPLTKNTYMVIGDYETSHPKPTETSMAYRLIRLKTEEFKVGGIGWEWSDHLEKVDA